MEHHDGVKPNAISTKEDETSPVSELFKKLSSCAIKF